MTKNCRHCGESFTPRDTRNVVCSEECRAADHREIEKLRMRRRRAGLRPAPFSIGPGPLLRLADVPQHIRVKAFRELVDSGELKPDEIPVALAAVLEPGDLSTRAA